MTIKKMILDFIRGNREDLHELEQKFDRFVANTNSSWEEHVETLKARDLLMNRGMGAELQKPYDASNTIKKGDQNYE